MENKIRLNQNLKIIIFVLVATVFCLWFYGMRFWVSTEERTFLAYLQNAFENTNEPVSLDGFVDGAWSKICVLTEYDDTYSESLGNAPDEIKRLNWRSYSGEIPDTRESAATLLNFDRYKWVFLFVNEKDVIKIAPLSANFILEGKRYNLRGGNFKRCMNKGSVYLQKNDQQQVVLIDYRGEE